MSDKLNIVLERRERIESVAIKTPEGVIYQMDRPARHHHVLHAMSANNIHPCGCYEGYWTSNHRFVNRIDGLNIARNAGQLNSLREQPNSYKGPELFSEDLW